jgi:hypothetical protein
MSGDRTRIPELRGIEFTGHASIKRYSSKLREVQRDLAMELDWGAEELYAVLCAQKGHPLLAGLDIRLRARRVCRRLNRIAELNAGAAVEAVRFYAQFRQEFQDVIAPGKPKPKKNFDFNDHDD